MREAADFFESFRAGILAGLNTVSIARIVSYDPASMSADIEVLPGGDLVTSVPVSAQRGGGFVIRVPYKKDDLVVVLFSQRDIDAIMHGEGDATDRVLSLDDAIIVSGVSPFTDPLPAGNANDLVIGKEDFSAKIVLTAAGGVQIIAPGGVTIQGSTTTGSW